MLERMREIMERIDELNTSFRGMAPRRIRREKATFASALQEAQQAPLARPGAPGTPGGAAGTDQGQSARPNLSAVAPLAAPSPASLGAMAATSRSALYADLIRKYAQANGVDPQLVQRVIEAESGYDPRSVSKKGALGLMQLMPETARELGVTDPFDPEQNIAGGTKYLAMMLDRFQGDLHRALAAYNAGPTVVQNHGGIPPFPETKRFIAKVLRQPSPRPPTTP
ncbi:MAG: Membrane-bound lytic murein transglycosylase D precursor [Candidatus Ozemobacter sibiricus]|jgi:soluble lytic murein transglycosylase-like protein|uniref:Membrane-bound lytic murein transglycosylase D n=1 Tax=Candidatus Ozemobacter sibiricus TaxID=2268124 RepID=A0A367ZPQ4_9BACT|nr:MAG: Membrane-bound lytic murein transglycosylase D precursor [Candidatus Ozemobacter sibiricus]